VENVIEFPTKSVRDRASLERAIRDGLNDEGLPPKNIETVIANMSGFIDALCFDFNFSISTADAISISRQMHEFQSLLDSRTNALISERVKMEVLRLVTL
jgi:hypothetical protein